MANFRKIEDVVEHVEDTLLAKNDSYSFANRKVALALSIAPQYSIIVRLMEKVVRIDNILKGPSPDMEKIQEEFIDIAGYGILGAFESVKEDNIWPAPYV
jgi:hypothetical protein